MKIVKLMYDIVYEGGHQHFLQECTIVDKDTTSRNRLFGDNPGSNTLALSVGVWPKFLSFCALQLPSCYPKETNSSGSLRVERMDRDERSGRAYTEGLFVWEIRIHV